MYVYTVSGDSLTEKTKFRVTGEITVIKYSTDGQTVAVTSGKNIILFDSASYQVNKHRSLFLLILCIVNFHFHTEYCCCVCILDTVLVLFLL